MFNEVESFLKDKENHPHKGSITIGHTGPSNTQTDERVNLLLTHSKCVHKMAEQVVKYSEWLTQTRESSAYKYFAMG